jgi:hypothetical protein
MANCIDDFNKEVDKLVDRYADIYSFSRRLSRAYGTIYGEDLVFAGLIHSGCTIYKDPSEPSFIGICGDKAMGVMNVTYTRVISSKTIRETFHKLLVEKYFMRMPSIPTSMWANLKERSYLIYIAEPVIEMAGFSRVVTYFPKSRIIEVAKRYGLSPPTIITHESPLFGETGEYSIDLDTCWLTRILRSVYTNCPKDLITSEGFCKLLDAILGIFKDAVEFYSEILNNGVKFLNLYLLY